MKPSQIGVQILVTVFSSNNNHRPFVTAATYGVPEESVPTICSRNCTSS